MIVADASALIDVLLATPMGRQVLPVLEETRVAHVPTLVDAEVAAGLRTIERRKAAPSAQVAAALSNLAGLRLVRHPLQRLLPRAWELRRNFTVYDAFYVVLAEAAELPLLTTDRRLARAVRRHTDVPIAS